MHSYYQLPFYIWSLTFSIFSVQQDTQMYWVLPILNKNCVEKWNAIYLDPVQTWLSLTTRPWLFLNKLHICFPVSQVCSQQLHWARLFFWLSSLCKLVKKSKLIISKGNRCDWFKKQNFDWNVKIAVVFFLFFKYFFFVVYYFCMHMLHFSHLLAILINPLWFLKQRILYK